MAKQSPRVAERKVGASNRMSPRIAERRSMAGKNPAARQVETSMSKKYKGTPKVSQGTIDRIKGMGMTSALKKASSSKNPEFIEGLRRMYGAKRVNQAMKPVKKAAPAMAQKQSARAVEGRTKSTVKTTTVKIGAPGNRGGFRGQTTVTTTKKKAAAPKPKPKTSAPKPFAPGGRSR